MTFRLRSFGWMGPVTKVRKVHEVGQENSSQEKRQFLNVKAQSQIEKLPSKEPLEPHHDAGNRVAEPALAGTLKYEGTEC